VGDVVEVFLPTDRATGRPRGFAFVEFADESAAYEAIEKLNGHELNGRSLRVTEAQERRPSGPPRMPQQFDDRGDFDDRGGGFGKRSKPKGSRRNMRGRKRSL